MSDLDEAFDLAAGELKRRMSSKELRAEIPDHVLIKWLDAVQKREDQKRREADQTARDEETLDVLELIDKSRLPPKRKLAMLSKEIKQATKRLRSLEERAAELEEEQ